MKASRWAIDWKSIGKVLKVTYAGTWQLGRCKTETQWITCLHRNKPSTRVLGVVDLRRLISIQPVDQEGSSLTRGFATTNGAHMLSVDLRLFGSGLVASLTSDAV